MKRQGNRMMKTGQLQFGPLGVVFVVLIFGIFQSCSKKEFDFSRMTKPEWNPTWALPLINSTLSARDILRDSNNIFIEDPNTHMLTLSYETRLFSENAEQYLVIPDQENIKIEETNLYIVVPPTDSVQFDINVPFSFTPPLAGQRLDSIFLKAASFKIDLSSYINHSLKVVVSIPNAIKNGKIFKTTLALDYAGTLPVTDMATPDLSGYKMLLNNTPGHTNEITASYHFVVYGDSNPNLSPYTFIANCDLVNIQYSKIFGYFGQYEFPMNDTLYLNIFNNNAHGSIQLKEIELLLRSINSAGMPIEINVLDLKAHSKFNPPYVVNIADPASGFPNPINIPAPDIAHIGSVADTTIRFGENNSNIVPAISISPEFIYFNVNGKSNPAGNPAYKNFVCDTSRFSLDLSLLMPLFGSISGFYVADTVDFESIIPDDAKMAEFKVRTVNHFPLDGEIQVYFADKDYKILDSLFSGNDDHVLIAAPVGGPPEYRVIESPPPEPFIFSPAPFLGADIEKLKNAKFIMLKAKLTTYKTGLVKIYADYVLDLKIAAKIELDTQN